MTRRINIKAAARESLRMVTRETAKQNMFVVPSPRIGQENTEKKPLPVRSSSATNRWVTEGTASSKPTCVTRLLTRLGSTIFLGKKLHDIDGRTESVAWRYYTYFFRKEKQEGRTCGRTLPANRTWYGALATPANDVGVAISNTFSANPSIFAFRCFPQALSFNFFSSVHLQSWKHEAELWGVYEKLEFETQKRVVR